jgi:TonB-linked SusC/RagA family outer membrane protein
MKAKKSLRGLLCPKQKYILLRIPALIMLIFLHIAPLLAQQQVRLRLTGTVRSQKDGKVMPGATVTNRRSGAGIITDQNGQFELSATDTSGVLVITFIGYRTAEVPFNRSHTGPFQISLWEDAAVLNEVTVSTGYQTLPKERVTGSFAQVDNQLLNRRVSTDILSRLEGVVPGLLFNRNTVNGSAGQVDLSIRGHNTLFTNDQPLIIVDGFPYDGDISNINPNDIESITVLKDAAAASIWGVRSGNGVIVLTTQKGKRNQKLAVELNANVTVGDKPDLYYNRNFLASNDFINLEQALFAKGAYDSYLGTGYNAVTPVVALLAQNRAGQLSDADLTAQLNALRNTDVRKDLGKYFYQQSVSQQYALNLKGGSEKSDYFFSLGDDHNTANLVGNHNNRISINASYNFYPIKNLQISAQVNYVKSSAQTDNTVQSITMGNTAAIYPYAKLADGSGNALAIVKDYAASYTDTAGHGKFLDWQYKPLDELHNADNQLQSVDNRINLGIRYSFFKNFSADIKYQYEGSSTSTNNIYSLATYYTRNLINQFSQFDANGNLVNPVPMGGILQQSASSLTSNRVRGQLNYHNTWNEKHEFTAIMGSEISSAVSKANSNTVYGYDPNTLTNIPSVDFSGNYLVNPDGSTRQVLINEALSMATDRYLSYYSNAGYTYGGRYSITASARIDHSNLFGVNTNQKAVPLYSVGTGWNLSKEGFYHVDWLPYAKIRVTLGYTGNINTSATAVTTIEQFSRATYSGIPFSLVINPGNPDLRWEKVRMINFGFDFATKNEILSGSIEYYRKKGTDLFGNAPLPPSTGLTTFFGNTADIAGNGIDIVLNSQNIHTKNFGWTTNFLLSHVLDKVTRYKQTLNSSNYIFFSNSSSIYPLEGKSLYGLYSYKWAGLSHTTGDPQGYLNGNVSTDYAGILANTTVNDMVYNGPSRPTTFGSLRNTFNYRELSLSLNLIYKLNYYFRRTSFTSSGLPYSGNQDFYKRWQSPGDELHTNVPSLQYPPYTSNRDDFYQYASVLVDKGDHIRLQDITLSYDFDKSKYKGLPFAQLRLYSYVNNVAILWRANHDGLDPDLSGNTTGGNYPMPRTFSFGVKAIF